MSWAALLFLAGGAYGFKLLGVMMGGRFESALLRQAVMLLPPALFAAVIIVQTFERAGDVVIDARLVGVAVAVIATWRKVPFIGVIVLAMVATALARVLFG